MTIKEHFIEIKESALVQEAILKLKPTWEIIKSKDGYKTLIISAIILAICYPVSYLIRFISGIIGATSIIGSMSYYSLTDAIESLSYLGGHYLVATIIVTIISILLSLVSYIIVTFIVPNATFNSYKILVDEERQVSIGEYFSLAFKNLWKYSVKLFLNVILPLWIVGIIGAILNFIPLINGRGIVSFTNSFIVYGLYFRFLAMMLELDYEKLTAKYAGWWLTFAVAVYLVKCVISFNLLVEVINLAFILFSLLVLKNSNSADRKIDLTKTAE